MSREIHPRLAIFLERIKARVTRSARHKLYCVQQRDGEQIEFRLEILRKTTSTRTGVTGSIDLGADAGTWARICRGSSVLGVHFSDSDSWAVAVPGELQTRTHYGSGGGHLATEGGSMVYWRLGEMRTISADGRLIGWNDPAAVAERRAVLATRRAEEAEIEEHEGQVERPYQPTILELLGAETEGGAT